MADVTQEQVVEYIKGISVLELSQLVKTLEEELGVSAAAAMPVALAGAAAPGAADAAEEQTEFTVTENLAPAVMIFGALAPKNPKPYRGPLPAPK